MEILSFHCSTLDIYAGLNTSYSTPAQDNVEYLKIPKMQHVIIRTKLQAAIAKKLLDNGHITAPFHMILVFRIDEPNIEQYCLELIPFTQKITRLNRPKLGFTSIFLYFLYLAFKSKIYGEKIFLANINWYTFALAARLAPDLKVTTFDDGNANILSASSYFLERPKVPNNLMGWFAQLVFPKGPSWFMRGRIDEHFTIYPGFKNIVEESKVRVLKMDWDSLVSQQDGKLLPQNVHKILLGTVLEETKIHTNTPITETDFQKAVAWADLYIPHPRVSHAITNNVIKKYTAETIIGYYLKSGPITVAHFNSSATIPFQKDPNARLIDLNRENVSALFK